MKQFAKIPATIYLLLIFITGCSDKNKNNSFTDILNKPPFAALTDSIEQAPGNDRLYFKRAILLNTRNLPAAALADFQKAWSLKKREEYALGISNLLLESSSDSAIQFIKQALADLPESLLLKITLARSYSDAGKTDEALQTCNEVLAQNPQQVDIIKTKAELLNKKGMNDAAMQMLEQAYSLTPYDIELNYILAFNYAENKNSKVLALCDSLIKADSLQVHGEPYYYKGIYYSNIGNKPEAIRQFDNCIKHDKFFHEGYIEKGAVYFEMKNYAEAFRVFKLCNTLSPDYAPAWYWMGKCQEATGQKEDAKSNYQKAYGLDKTMTAAKEAIERVGK